jgi:hypothetical protein
MIQGPLTIDSAAWKCVVLVFPNGLDRSVGFGLGLKIGGREDVDDHEKMNAVAKRFT